MTDLLGKSHEKFVEMTKEREDILSKIEKMQHEKKDRISDDEII